MLSADEELIPTREHHQRRKLFQWVLFPVKPLSPLKLQHALALEPYMTQTSIHDYETSDAFIAAENLETKVKHLSKGLIQLHGPFDSGWAEFIHQSVVDFLFSSDGSHILSGGFTMSPSQLAHFEISRSCLRYLFMSEIPIFLRDIHDTPTQVSGIGCFSGAESCDLAVKAMLNAFPFIEYAWHAWIFHAAEATSLGRSQDNLNYDLFDIFRWPSDQPILGLWTAMRRVLGSPLLEWSVNFCRHKFSHVDIDDHYHAAFLWPSQGLRLLHLLALCGLLGASVQERVSLANLEIATTGGVTPLVCAIVGEQEELAHRLIRADAVVQYSAKDPDLSPIHLASHWGNPGIVSHLIEKGAKVAPRDVKLCTPLHLAAASGNLAAAEVLVSAGAEVDDGRVSLQKGETYTKHPYPLTRYYEKEGTPLHFAAKGGHVNITEYLLKSGAQINKNSYHGRSTLHCAVGNRRSNAVSVLLQHGAHVDAQDSKGCTPLFVTLRKKLKEERTSLEVVQLLLEGGANPNHVDRARRTPLHLAATSGHGAAAELLLQHGAYVNAANATGETPPHLAVSVEDFEMVGILVKHGADMDARKNHDWSPLYAATKQRDPNITLCLIGAGADIKAGNRDTTTALRRAIYESNVFYMEFLFETGIDLNARDQYGETLLFMAVEVLEPKGVASLLQRGADPNVRDKRGETGLFKAVGTKPLFGVLQNKQVEVIRTLLQAGADPFVHSILGRTARSYSVKYEQPEIDKVLEEAGVPVGFLGDDPIHVVVLNGIKRMGRRAGLSFT